MGPRGGGAGFGFLHLIVGMISAAILVALFAALVLLLVKVATKKGWISKPKHRPHPHHGGPHPEPGAPPHPGQHGASDAQRILDERLARGEIEIDDYKARRDALAGTSYPPFHQPPSAPTPPPAGGPETRVDEHPPHE